MNALGAGYRGWRLWPVVAAALLVAGCSFFKDVKEVVHDLAQSGKGKGSEGSTATAPGAEPSHEGPLLDNKVTALRIEEALKQAGSNFAKVEVTANPQGVVLGGSVPSAADRARAEEIAKSVHRPVKLTNSIRVGK